MAGLPSGRFAAIFLKKTDIGDTPATCDATGNLLVASPGEGSPSDAAATTDTGTFSLIALFKRLLQKLTAGIGVQGQAASGATASGNPVLLAGLDSNGTLARTIELNTLAHSPVNVWATGVTDNFISNGGFALAPGGQVVPLVTFPMASNGIGTDQIRTNLEGQLLASAARTATTNSADQTNYNGRGVHILINATVLPSGSLTPKIQGKDPVSGAYYDLLVGPAIAATGLTVLKVYPGIAVAANGAASDILPRTWRVAVTHGDATSITYSVGYEVVN